MQTKGDPFLLAFVVTFLAYVFSLLTRKLFEKGGEVFFLNRTNKMIQYETALQAVAVARYNVSRHHLSVESGATFCVNTQENWNVLSKLATDKWEDGGVTFFAATERGDEWLVKMKTNP
jgi:hypothetical protein